MAADVGGAGQDLVHRAQTPAAAGAGADAVRIQILGDLPQAHGAGLAPSP